MLKLLLFLIVLNLLQCIICVESPLWKNEECGEGNDYKWITELYYQNGDQLIQNNCYATIINKDWLLSAASCIWDPKTPRNYSIHYPPDVTLNNQRHKQVEKIVRSPKYNPTKGAGYDIALIKIENGFRSDEQLMPICLPIDGFRVSTSCELAENNLQIEIDYSLIECHKQYGDVIEDKLMACVQDKRSGGACFGKTGAALMCKDDIDKDRWFLYGIASWPQKRCEKIFNVFTKLHDNDYIKWINKTVTEDLLRNKV